MPNDVIQFVRLVSPSANVAEAEAMPLIVPDGMAFRVRYCEFRHSGLLNADGDHRMAISIIAEQPAKLGDVDFNTYAKYIAYASWSMEASGTEGLMSIKSVQHIDVWDLDYRLVMRPTLHTLAVGAAQAMTAVLAGEMVQASQGERNAIIALQGGAK